MKKILAMTALMASVSTFAAVNDLVLTFSSAGPDTYADGTTVVWAPELWDKFLATADQDGVIPKSVLCDGCHPGVEGYRIWGEILKTYLPNR